MHRILRVGVSVGAFFKEHVDSLDILFFVGERFSVDFLGGPGLLLDGVCDSRHGGYRKLAFSTHESFLNGSALSKSLVLIDRLPAESGRGSNQFCVVEDPRAVFMDVLEWLIVTVGVEAHRRGFSREAKVSPSAQVAPGAIIEPHVEIGSGCIIYSGAIIKSGSRIGKDTIIRENSVVGCDGLTVYRAADGRLMKFPHVGGVCIGSRVEIGAGSVIAGGILAATTIGDEVVIGNLCNVGHGVIVEDGVWVSVGSLIGGHTKLHAGATVAMGVSIRDNLVIGAGASIGMGSVVVSDVGGGYSMFGNPAKRMPVLTVGPKR